MVEVKFEQIKSNSNEFGYVDQLRRAAVPNGWLVRYLDVDGGTGLTFVPDPKHEWK